MKIRLTLIAFVVCNLTFLSCSKKDGQYACIAVVDPVDVNFNVVDKNNDTDYFFSQTPKHPVKDLYFFTIRDRSRTDTIRPKVDSSGSAKSFKLRLSFELQDTLIMKLGNMPEARLVHKFKRNKALCPQNVLDKLYFNGTELEAVNGRFILKN